jgi:predicted MFS family arabinose efflux permease
VERRLLLLFAVACGASLANIYYAQPLLPDIAAQFGISDAGASIVVTVSQVAYSVGLLLIVPLGDLVERRRLIAGLLLACAGCMAVAAAAPSFAVLVGALALGALTSVVVQVLLPFAAVLAPPEERGRVVGEVMTGTLVGALSARTVSGLLASLGSWRVPFAFAALLSAALAAALWRALPAREPATLMRYHRLLLSVAALVRREPALRRRMAYGACGFAGFTLAWTTIPFLLAGPAYGLGPGAIGLFGLAGIAGALAARRLGRWHDRGRGLPATGWVLASILLSWPLLLLGKEWLPLVAVGLVLLDLGVQGQNVLSQGVIYALGPENAGRVTTAYVTSNFLAGALGSAVGSLAWAAAGWPAVVGAGAAFASLALAIWLTEAVRVRRMQNPNLHTG